MTVLEFNKIYYPITELIVGGSKVQRICDGDDGKLFIVRLTHSAAIMTTYISITLTSAQWNNSLDFIIIT